MKLKATVTIPQPNVEEPQAEFMKRCMADASMMIGHQNNDERQLFCAAQWNSRSAPVLHRAYAVVSLKASGEGDSRIIEGIATTPTPDRYNDVVEPKGMEFSLPLPLLYQHNSRQPIGQVIEAKVTNDGIKIKAQVAPIGVAGFIDEAWSLIKAGLMPGLSIGFRGLEEAYNKETGGFHYIRSEWMELSVVTIPANAEANITNIKSADAKLLTAIGRGAERKPKANLPGVSGKTKGKQMKKTIAEQVREFENKRAANQARMLEITELAGDDARTFTAEETEEFETLEREVKEIDAHIPRLKTLEKQMIERAVPISQEVGSDPEKGAQARSVHSPIQVTRNLPKGIGMARMIIALHKGQGNRQVAAQIAAVECKDTPEVEMVLKTEIIPGTTVGTSFASALFPPAQVLYGEFLDLLRPATILGRIPSIRYVPFNVTVPAQTGGGTFGWVGENNPKPVTSLAFSTVTLPFNKVAGIVPMSKELLRFGVPSTEILITNSLVKDTAQFIDTQLFDPTVHLSTGVQPASFTDQVVNKVASGTTAAAFRADLAVQIKVYITNNDDPREIVILMSATTALSLSLIRNALGQKEFPDLTVNGGSVEGFPVIVSEAISNRIIFLKASDVIVADGGVEIDMSQEASLVMTDAPGSSPAATSLVSLYQRNLVAIRVEKLITWKKGRTHTCQYISGAVYTG
jgi:HK97 family phage major capsid protein/HK97 family phage prohead protease